MAKGKDKARLFVDQPGKPVRYRPPGKKRRDRMDDENYTDHPDFLLAEHEIHIQKKKKK